jgi:hypothetical protein
VRALGARAIGPKAVHARWRLADGSALNITVNLAEEGLRESLEQLVRPAGADVLFDSGGALEALAEGTSPATPSWSCASRQRRWSAHHERGHPQPSAHHRRDLTCVESAASPGTRPASPSSGPMPTTSRKWCRKTLARHPGRTRPALRQCRRLPRQPGRNWSAKHAVGYLPPLLTGVQHQPVALPTAVAPAWPVLPGRAGKRRAPDAADFIRPEPAARLAAHRGAGYHRLLVAGHILTLAIAPARCYTIADALADGQRARLGTGRAGLRSAQR